MKTFINQLRRIENVLKKHAPTIIGTEAVNHFTENFDKQSFDGKKWKDVKRRDPSSSWYGFKLGSKTPLPPTHPKRGSTGKYKKRKVGSATNYSPTARNTPILSSQKSDLENSLSFTSRPGKVVIYSNKPYAKVHNEGASIRVFGKHSAKVPKRPFIGRSRVLDKKIERAFNKHLKS